MSKVFFLQCQGFSIIFHRVTTVLTLLMKCINEKIYALRVLNNLSNLTYLASHPQVSLDHRHTVHHFTVIDFHEIHSKKLSKRFQRAPKSHPENGYCVSQTNTTDSVTDLHRSSSLPASNCLCCLCLAGLLAPLALAWRRAEQSRRHR